MRLPRYSWIIRELAGPAPPPRAPSPGRLEFYTHEVLGGSIGHTAGLARVDFADEPAAISIPFATLPATNYIRGERYQVQFDRTATPRSTAAYPSITQEPIVPADAPQSINAAIFDRLAASPGPSDQQAIDEVNNFTRTRMLEEGFFRRIMPVTPITNDELDRSISTDRPVRIAERDMEAELFDSVLGVPHRNPMPASSDRLFEQLIRHMTDSLGVPARFYNPNG